MSVSFSNIVDVADFDSVTVRDGKSIKIAKDSNVDASLVPDFAFALTPNAVRGKELITKIFDNEKSERYEKVIVVAINGFLIPTDLTMDRDAMDFRTMVYELGKCFDTTCASFLFIPFGSKAPPDDRIS